MPYLYHFCSPRYHHYVSKIYEIILSEKLSGILRFEGNAGIKRKGKMDWRYNKYSYI